MNLIPWRSKRNKNEIQRVATDPDVNRFLHEANRLFDRFFEDPFGLTREPMTFGGGWVPSLDVVESEKKLTVKAELPGMDPKDLNITISGNVLTVSGEKRESTEEKYDSWYLSERRFGTFRRSVQLPSNIDTEKVSAEHVNGVLTIHLDKLNSAPPKRVTVKSSAS